MFFHCLSTVYLIFYNLDKSFRIIYHDIYFFVKISAKINRSFLVFSMHRGKFNFKIIFDRIKRLVIFCQISPYRFHLLDFPCKTLNLTDIFLKLFKLLTDIFVDLNNLPVKTFNSKIITFHLVIDTAYKLSKSIFYILCFLEKQLEILTSDTAYSTLRDIFHFLRQFHQLGIYLLNFPTTHATITRRIRSSGCFL